MKSVVRILVIEDDWNDFDYLQRMIARHPKPDWCKQIYIENAASYAAALWRLGEANWDLLVVDYNLGVDKNGLDLIRKACEDGSQPYSILILSGVDDVPLGDFEKRLLDAGKLAQLSKDELNWAIFSNKLSAFFA